MHIALYFSQYVIHVVIGQSFGRYLLPQYCLHISDLLWIWIAFQIFITNSVLFNQPRKWGERILGLVIPINNTLIHQPSG